jgi:hypothetical protein
MEKIGQEPDMGEEQIRLRAAFSAENRQSDFDWNAHYQPGFDIITMRIAN